MKIIMTLSNSFKPDPRVYKEAKSLVKHGYEVTIIAWDREGEYPEEELFEGIKIKRIKLKSKYGDFLDFAFKLPLFYLKVLRMLLKEDFDVIHTHDFDTALLGFIMKFWKRKKWVYDIHDLYFTYFSNKTIARIIKAFDILLAKHSDIVIVTTHSLGGRYEGHKEFYVKNGIPSEKIVTIWNTPCLEEFLNYEKVDLKKSEKITIGFIGSVRSISDFILLFEAIKQNPDLYKVIFVGFGKDFEKLKKIAKDEYSYLDIEFIDHVNYKLISNYYRLCDVIFGVVPFEKNAKRSIPVKVFESAVLGIPCIVLAGTLAEDFVKKYQCGIAIKKTEIKDFEKKLREVKKIKFNPEIIQKEWNWEKEEEKLIKIHKSLMKMCSL